MTISNSGNEKPSSASSGLDFSPSSWLDFRNFTSFDKVGYKISKLDGLISKIKQRDSRLFKKVVMAMQTQDVEKARSLSLELLELRRTLRILVDSRNAIELVLTRTTGHVEINDSTALPNSSKSDRLAVLEPQPELNQDGSSTGTVLINSGVKRYEIYRNNCKSNHHKKSSESNTPNRRINRKSEPHY